MAPVMALLALVVWPEAPGIVLTPSGDPGIQIGFEAMRIKFQKG